MYNDLELRDSLGDKLKENTQRSIEAKTKAVYDYLLELSEKASNDGANELKLKPSDDTIILFRDKVIRNRVASLFKEENIKFKVITKVYSKQNYIHISW